MRPQYAFNRAADLPPEEQDQFAGFVLAELEADQEWDRLFALPESDELLSRLAMETLADHRAGATRAGATRAGAPKYPP